MHRRITVRSHSVEPRAGGPVLPLPVGRLRAAASRPVRGQSKSPLPNDLLARVIPARHLRRPAILEERRSRDHPRHVRGWAPGPDNEPQRGRQAQACRDRNRQAPARSYRLVVDGKTYDSKAIVGAAHGFLPGQEPLAPADFSGGAATVGRLLSSLGFQVTQAASGLTVGKLIELLSALRPYRSPSGRQALYQPLALLWAVGRAHQGLARMAEWSETEAALGEFLERHGNIHGRTTQSRRCTTLACGISAVRGRCHPRTATRHCAGSPATSLWAACPHRFTTSSGTQGERAAVPGGAVAKFSPHLPCSVVPVSQLALSCCRLTHLTWFRDKRQRGRR